MSHIALENDMAAAWEAIGAECVAEKERSDPNDEHDQWWLHLCLNQDEHFTKVGARETSKLTPGVSSPFYLSSLFIYPKKGCNVNSSVL